MDMKAFLTASNDETHKIDLAKEALVLMEGEITVLKNGEDCISVNPGYIIGLHYNNLLSLVVEFRTKNAKIMKFSKKVA